MPGRLDILYFKIKQEATLQFKGDVVGNGKAQLLIIFPNAQKVPAEPSSNTKCLFQIDFRASSARGKVWELFLWKF